MLVCTVVLVAALMSVAVPSSAGAQGPQHALTADAWDDSSTGSGRAAWEAGAVVLSADGSRAGAAWLRSKTPLSGDFDAQVSFELIEWQGDLDATICMAMAVATPDDADERTRQTIRVGRTWADALDQYDARVLKGGEWRMRSGAIETAA
jgi:hypothetical protein